MCWAHQCWTVQKILSILRGLCRFRLLGAGLPSAQSRDMLSASKYCVLHSLVWLMPDDELTDRPTKSYITGQLASIYHTQQTTRPLMHGRCALSSTISSLTTLQTHTVTVSQATLRRQFVMVTLAHTRLPSVRFRRWSRFLAVSLQVAWVINPAVGCHNFPPGLQLPSQPLKGL